MTQWIPISELGTLWTKTTSNSTDYNGRIVVDLGGQMDDATYKMDDATLTLSDAKVNSSVTPPQTWTKT